MHIIKKTGSMPCFLCVMDPQRMLCAVLGLCSVLRAVQQREVAVVILAVVHIEFFVLTAVQIFGVIVLILYNLRFF